MITPPHLPPQTCVISHHRSWQRIKLVIISTLFGALAGLTTAALFAAFFTTFTLSPEGFVVTSHTTPEGSVSEAVNRRVASTVFTLYKKSSTLGGVTYLDPTDRLAEAVVGVSSGWLVASVPAYDGMFKDWRVVGEEGALFEVTKVLYDKYLGLAYVRVERLLPAGDSSEEQLKVALFTTSFDAPSVVFVRRGGELVPTRLVPADSRLFTAHLDTVPTARYTLRDSFPAGSVVVNADGAVLGFVRQDNRLIPTATVGSILAGISDRPVVTYRTLGVEGWFSDEAPLYTGAQSFDGLLVTRVLSSSSGLRRGDTIREINGRPVRFETIWYTSNEPTARLKVFRAGKELELTVSFQSL